MQFFPKLPGTFLFVLCGFAVSAVATGITAVALAVGAIFSFVQDCDIVVGLLACRYSAVRSASANVCSNFIANTSCSIYRYVRVRHRWQVKFRIVCGTSTTSDSEVGTCNSSLSCPGPFFCFCVVLPSLPSQLAGITAVALVVGAIFFFVHDCDIVVGPLACRYGAARSASALQRFLQRYEHFVTRDSLCLSH